MNTKRPNETALNSVDESRRDFVKKLVAGTAFAAPLLASFSMGGALLGEAEAAGAAYFCGYTAITDIVFRAAGRTEDNAARFSAIARADQLDCRSMTVNLVFTSKVYSFASAILQSGTYEYPLNEGQTTLTQTVFDLLESLSAGNGTITIWTNGGPWLSAPLVGVGV